MNKFDKIEALFDRFFAMYNAENHKDFGKASMRVSFINGYQAAVEEIQKLAEEKYNEEQLTRALGRKING